MIKAVPEDMPSHWATSRLGDLLNEKDVRVNAIPEADAKTIEVLSLTKNSGLIPQSERFGKRIATQEIDDYKVVREGWIVYNPYVIWEGAVHALKNRRQGAVSPVYCVWETRDNDGGYLDYLLRTPLLIDAYNMLASGAVNRRRSIRKTAFVSIEVATPPLTERKRIAEYLSVMDNSRRATQRTIIATRRLRASLTSHLFSYGPVAIDRVEQVPMKATEIGSIPKHWDVVAVGDYATIAQYGLSVRGMPQGKYPMLRMNSLVDGALVASDLQYIDLDDEVFAKYRLEPGDLLFNRTNSFDLVGKTGHFELQGDYVFASYLVRLRFDTSRVNPKCLNYYLNMRTTQERLKMLATRAVSQSNINATKLKGLKMPLPPLHEQQAIAQQLQVVDEVLAVERARYHSISALFKSVLHHLMTGKVRVGTEQV